MKQTYEELAVQLANAESKCRELAAENVELKSDRDTLARYWIEDGGDEECAMSYCEQTPATDAFLAEVRAQARNELINEFESRFNEMTETLPPELRSGAAGAAAFVSTFRKGAAL